MVGWVCSNHNEMTCIQYSSWKTWREENFGYVLRDQGIDGMIILKMDLRETGCEVVYWTRMDQDRDCEGLL
jgi:hypothetical protein